MCIRDRLSTRPGKAVFERAYWAYKSFIEAGDLKALEPHVAAGSTVIDVGANIGFFTVPFARWAGPGGHVIAIEPEAANFASLAARVERLGLGATVSLINAAAVEAPGEVHLMLNPDNPADHRVAATGARVDAVSIDSVMEARGWPRVSMIKIDVQGGEPRVLRGARKTLERLRPALFVEFQEDCLVLEGTSSRELMGEFSALGYAAHVLEGRDAWVRIDADGLDRRMQARGYLDVLLLPHKP